MVDQDAIRALLDDLRFDEAEESASDPSLRAEVASRRAAAESEAVDLLDQIAASIADGRMADLSRTAEDERSRRLLTLLPASDRRTAEMHLDEALRWKAYKQRTSVRHLTEARAALDRLDVELARGLVNKVDGRFLSAQQLEERDRLLLDISARSMELESLESAGRDLIDEVGDPDTQSWWRRWLD